MPYFGCKAAMSLCNLVNAVVEFALPLNIVWVNAFRAWPASIEASNTPSWVPWAAYVLAIGCHSLMHFTFWVLFWNSGVATMDFSTGSCGMTCVVHSVFMLWIQ